VLFLETPKISAETTEVAEIPSEGIFHCKFWCKITELAIHPPQPTSKVLSVVITP
jgi:hypothetical protein